MKSIMISVINDINEFIDFPVVIWVLNITVLQAESLKSCFVISFHPERDIILKNLPFVQCDHMILEK